MDWNTPTAFRLQRPRSTGGPDQVRPERGGRWRLLYFGTPYPSNAHFYNNIQGFFQSAVSQKHNLSFSGASPDNRVTYRVSGGATKQTGNIPNMSYNVEPAGQLDRAGHRLARHRPIMSYSYATNDQPFKGVYGTPATCVGGGPMLGLLVYPDTIDARDYLTPSGRGV